MNKNCGNPHCGHPRRRPPRRTVRRAGPRPSTRLRPLSLLPPSRAAPASQGKSRGTFTAVWATRPSPVLEEKLAVLEHAEAAAAVSSGMGAVTTVLWTALKAGDHVVADETLYGCTFAYLSHASPASASTSPLSTRPTRKRSAPPCAPTPVFCTWKRRPTPT